jgi:hypothetical protein
MESVHLGLNPRFAGCSYFSGFILRFTGAILLVVDDFLVNSEAPMVRDFINFEI